MNAAREAYEWGFVDGECGEPYGLSAGRGWNRRHWRANSDGYNDGRARREKGDGQ